MGRNLRPLGYSSAASAAANASITPSTFGTHNSAGHFFRSLVGSIGNPKAVSRGRAAAMKSFPFGALATHRSLQSMFPLLKRTLAYAKRSQKTKRRASGQ